MYFQVCRGDFQHAGTPPLLLHVIMGFYALISICGKVFRNANVSYNEDLGSYSIETFPCLVSLIFRAVLTMLVVLMGILTV